MVDIMTYITNKDFLLEVQKGNIPGHSFEQKFAENPDIDRIEEDIWDGGGDYGFYPSSAQAMEVLSDDANDTSAGTGLRTVKVYGLDSNFDLQEETATLDGVSVVNLSNAYIRIYRMIGQTAGSGGKNAGEITCRIQGGGTIAAIIKQGNNQTLMSQYTIPNGKSGYLYSGYATINKGGDASVKFWLRPEGGIFQLKQKINIYQSTYIRPFVVPLKLDTKTDVKVTATTTNNNVSVQTGYDLLLVED